MRLIAALTAILLSAACPAFAAPSAAEIAAVRLAPHRAVYDLSLGQVKGARAPVAATGRIAYDFSGSACEGYSTAFRQFTELQPSEGEARASDMRSAVFESGDGRDLQFRIETTMPSGETRIAGKAHRSQDGALSIQLSQPAPAQVDLGEQVLFPTAHVKAVIAAAKAGERTFAVKVYDGSDTGQKIYDTLAVIGPALEGDAADPAAGALKGVRRWPVSISFFEMGKFDAPPIYVLGFELYENGISRSLKLDYGDFVIDGTMTKLEVLAEKGCAKN